MRIAIAQINSVIGDFTGNSKIVVHYARRAKQEGADLVVFPELSLCGYPPMDLLERDWFVEENLKALRWIQHNAPASIGIVVGYVGKNRTHSGKRLVNIVSLIEDRRILTSQAKTLLPTYDVFDEARYFQPASARIACDYKGERLGFAICEDIWWETDIEANSSYPIDPVHDLLNDGATLIIAPSASPYYTGKPRTRLSLLTRIGKASGVPVIYVNTTGANDGLIFDGQSMVTSPQGRLVHLAKAFEEQLLVVNTCAWGAERELSSDATAEIERALVFGIKDYAAKCGFARAHLGLSGGIDSAVVATLAARALGPDQVTALVMPSQYSSPGSRQDAEQLAGNLGLAIEVIPIESIFAAFLAQLRPSFRDRPPDLTEENLQARIRGTLLMAYANKFGDSLLLATGNKSELATGYCTLYGDMAGGLAVIGDVLKTEVYALARHLNEDGVVIPPTILAKAPTAELRPNQTDQDSLPPYEVLDRILSLHLVDNYSPERILEQGFDPGLVRHVLTLVERAEYKRRQAPPVLKVTRRAFGMGRRIPIARHIDTG